MDAQPLPSKYGAVARSRVFYLAFGLCRTVPAALAKCYRSPQQKASSVTLSAIARSSIPHYLHFQIAEYTASTAHEHKIGSRNLQTLPTAVDPFSCRYCDTCDSCT
jgi:hypothetical protein